MRKNLTLCILIAAMLSSGVVAFGYDFWGVNVGTASYDGMTHLTFSGLSGSGIQYVVGGYKYTQVDSQWLGPFAAAAPGEGYLASRKSDAQGLFFKPTTDAAQFMVITGSSQAGAPAPEVGTGTRLFGPGDLKIDLRDATYGVGMRASGLTWAVDPYTTNPEYLLHQAEGGTANIYSRDTGTAGTVEMDPRWARAGHSTVQPGSDLAYAFFIGGSGTQTGSAEVTFQPTEIHLYGSRVYAYEISVPWAAIGLDPRNYSFRVSWRPDCGNDILSADFGSAYMMAPVVPEPGTSAGLLGGMAALAALRRRN